MNQSSPIYKLLFDSIKDEIHHADAEISLPVAHWAITDIFIDC